MFLFIIKRLLWFIPTLFVVSLFGFLLLSFSSQKAIQSYISKPSTAHSQLSVEQQKNYWTNYLGFNKPLFYFSVKPISSNKQEITHYVPSIKWHGTSNQYHCWLFGGNHSKGLLRGDFGVSYKTNQPVLLIIKERVGWSLFFSITSIFLAYVISIPLGIKLVAQQHSLFYRFTHRFLFFIYCLPPFFVGIVLLMLFANSDALNWLPASGIKPIEGYQSETLLHKITATVPYTILPLICYTYASLAFITKLTESSIKEQLHFDYIRTAKAKGLSNKNILVNHALKNGLLPLITVFTSVFPSIIGGSVIIENLFSIPGMGNETVKSIIANDYPVVIAIITISSVITLTAYLLADMLYAFVDKRINLHA